MNITAESLARIAYDAYFADDIAKNPDAISAYILDCNAESLRDALDIDIHDLLHNANIDLLFPDTTELDDDKIIEFLDNDNDYDSFIDALARIIES